MCFDAILDFRYIWLNDHPLNDLYAPLNIDQNKLNTGWVYHWFDAETSGIKLLDTQSMWVCVLKAVKHRLDEIFGLNQPFWERDKNYWMNILISHLRRPTKSRVTSCLCEIYIVYLCIESCVILWILYNNIILHFRFYLKSRIFSF